MNAPENYNPNKFIYVIFGVVFLTSGLLINSAQLVLYLILRPISKQLYRKINFYLTYSLCSQIIFLHQYWAKVKVTLHVTEDDYYNRLGKESAMLLMNHTYEVDWMLGWILGDHWSILGNIKTFAKKSLQYLPTLGYSWKLGGCIFLERNWQKDHKHCEALLQNLVSYKDDIWLFLAAEGTRFTKEKLEVCQAFARENNLPVLRYHLTPRTKGFALSIPILKKKISAIYSITLGIHPDSAKPTLTNILLGKSIDANFIVERFPVEELPESEAELAAWLHALYKRKDDLIHNYLTKGNWIVNPDDKKYKPFILRPRIFTAVNFGVWFLCVVPPLGYFFTKLLLSGSFLGLGTVAGVIGSFVYMTHKLIGETQISKASSYGIPKDLKNHKTRA